MKLTLALILASLSLATLAPAAASDRPFYDHTMQALGSSELGMPPIRRDTNRWTTCTPTIFGEVPIHCE